MSRHLITIGIEVDDSLIPNLNSGNTPDEWDWNDLTEAASKSIIRGIPEFVDYEQVD